MKVRGEISKVCGTLGSCLVDNGSCSLLNGPTQTIIVNLENILEQIVSLEEMPKVAAQLSSLNADKPKGADSARLSKLWSICEPLAKGTADQTI